MSTRVKTKIGHAYLLVNLCCSEVAIKTSDDGKSETITCTAKTVKPECADSGVVNPNENKTDLLNQPVENTFVFYGRVNLQD